MNSVYEIAKAILVCKTLKKCCFVGGDRIKLLGYRMKSALS
jgi:hypothetical protein